jgi:hypothetical protein
MRYFEGAIGELACSTKLWPHVAGVHVQVQTQVFGGIPETLDQAGSPTR